MGYGDARYGEIGYGAGSPSAPPSNPNQTVNTASLASAGAFGNPTITFAQARSILAASSAGAFGNPTVTSTQSATAVGIATGESLGLPQIFLTGSDPQAVEPLGFVSYGVVGTGVGLPSWAITGSFPVSVTAQGLATVETVRTPAVFLLPPAVFVNGVRRWTLTEEGWDDGYVFQINPKAGGEVPYAKNISDSYRGEDGSVLVMQQAVVPASEFSGTILSREQYEALWSWFKKGVALTMRDDLGRTQRIFITEFKPDRRRVASHPYLHDYTCRYLSLSSVDI